MIQLGLPKANVPITDKPASLDWYKFFVRLVDYLMSQPPTFQEYIENGQVFVHSGKTSLSTGATYNHLLVTPSSGTEVMLTDYLLSVTDGPFDLTIFEDATCSSNGTTISAYNQNRNFDDPPETQLFHTPTITSDGTQIFYALLPGANNVGGLIQPGMEDALILKPGKKYILRMKNNDGNNVDTGLTIRFVEGSFS